MSLFHLSIVTTVYGLISNKTISDYSTLPPQWWKRPSGSYKVCKCKVFIDWYGLEMVSSCVTKWSRWNAVYYLDKCEPFLAFTIIKKLFSPLMFGMNKGFLLTKAAEPAPILLSVLSRILFYLLTVITACFIIYSPLPKMTCIIAFLSNSPSMIQRGS